MLAVLSVLGDAGFCKTTTAAEKIIILLLRWSLVPPELLSPSSSSLFSPAPAPCSQRPCSCYLSSSPAGLLFDIWRCFSLFDIQLLWNQHRRSVSSRRRSFLNVFTSWDFGQLMRRRIWSYREEAAGPADRLRAQWNTYWEIWLHHKHETLGDNVLINTLICSYLTLDVECL